MTGTAGRCQRGWRERVSARNGLSQARRRRRGGSRRRAEPGARRESATAATQPKLLRVLETGRIRRVGGAGESAVSVRVVAMTLRDLGLEARRGGFRADLYYRLAGFELALPPLRNRRGDIALLVRHFLRELAPELGGREIEPAAMAALGARC